jgi:hypothetical protein
LSPPNGFEVKNGRHVRLALRNLPLPLPTTPSIARAILQYAYSAEGVSVLTDAAEAWNFDIQLPAAWDALRGWAHDHGYEVRLSQAGRYAMALLGRIGDLQQLDVLADELRIRALKVLTPESRLKLTQRLTGAVAEEHDANEEQLASRLAERISDVGLFLEVESRPVDDLTSILQENRPAVLAAVAPLVKTGLIQRGRTTRCPHCNYNAFVSLGELDERIRCRACRESYVLPVVDSSGRREPATTYRLDGLMARAMDQDLLPVLLTLRAMRPPPGASELFFAWPGLEFRQGEAVVETDLLTSDGDRVWIGEVKNNAASLADQQVDRLLELAHGTRARPVIAGLEGQFPEALVTKVRESGGQILVGPDLLR